MQRWESGPGTQTKQIAKHANDEKSKSGFTAVCNTEKRSKKVNMNSPTKAFPKFPYHPDSVGTKTLREVLLCEKAFVGIAETTQLLSSVPVGEMCRDKGANEDVLSFISITLARFVCAPLTIPLARKKTVDLAKTCCARQLRLAKRSAVSCGSQKDKT